MTSHFVRVTRLSFVLVLLFNVAPSLASEWHTADLPARALNITENHGTLWVCGADELIAASVDGGNTWTAKHVARNGSLLLTIGFANERFGFAAGTAGRMFATRDGGETWSLVKVPSQVVYEASFTDEKHGIIHTPREIYTTRDGGQTWLSVPIDLASNDLREFS
jgi:photosystem II stability/assembly factor-like uncharacterized protein